MSKSDVWENELLKLTFNNVAAAGIGDAGGLQPSAAAGNFYVHLHTADPGEAGTSSTSETTYTGYVSLAVPRTTGGFTVTLNAVNLVNNLDFAACTAAPGAPLTHFSICDTASAGAKVRYSGTLSPNITMAVSVIPRLSNAVNLITED